MKNRLLAFLLTISILCSCSVVAFATDMVISPAPEKNWADIEGHWAEASLTRAAENGWINGNGNGLNPEGLLTRAELSAIVSRIFGATLVEDLTGYTDVPADAWYAEDIAAARRMQVIFGANMKMRPQDKITREETFTVLSRLFCIQFGDTDSINSFSDKGQISSWAKEATAAMIDAGYAKGSNGKLDPKANITRAAFVTLLDRMITDTAAGTYEKDVDGNLLVTAKDTTLKNMTIKGDLVLSEAVDAWSLIHLENVKVEGNIVLRNCTEKTVYKDDKSVISGKFVKNDLSRNGGGYTTRDLGVTNEVVYNKYCDGGKDKDGKNIVYMVNDGTPASFIGIRPETGEQVFCIPLELVDEKGKTRKSNGAWGVFVHSSGDCYVAAYGEALIYRWNVDTETLELIGPPAGGSTLPLVMTEDENGIIWGAQATSNSIYSLDPKTNKFTEYKLGDKDYGQYYSIADPDSEDVFVAARSSEGKAFVYRFNPKTGEKVNILPQKYVDSIGVVYDMRLVNGKLFCRSEVGSNLFVLDAKTGEEITFTHLETGEKLTQTHMNGRAVSPLSPVGNYVYFFDDVQFYKYNVDTDEISYIAEGVPDAWGTAPLNFIFLELDDPEFPGWSFVTLNSHLGSFLRYNLETNKLSFIQLVIEGNPTTGNCTIKANDGNIYIGGYIGASTGRYNPTTDEFEDLYGLRQVEGMGVYGDYVFFGRYPNSYISKYDTTKPWDTAASNPYLAMNMGTKADDPTYPNQDRPYNLLGIPEEKTMVVATIPKQGFYGSAIAFYDMEKNDDTFWSTHSVVPDLTITGIAYANRKVFFGTSIRPGSNTDPRATECELFSYNFATKEFEKYGVIIPGATAITAMTTASDGNVWGLANCDETTSTRLFIFDPKANKVIYEKNVSINNFGATWYGDKMTLSNDGTKIYVSDLYNVGIIPEDFRQTANIYSIDVKTKDVQLLIRDSGLYHVEDNYGNLYGVHGTNTYKYTFKK